MTRHHFQEKHCAGSSGKPRMEASGHVGRLRQEDHSKVQSQPGQLVRPSVKPQVNERDLEIGRFGHPRRGGPGTNSV